MRPKTDEMRHCDELLVRQHGRFRPKSKFLLTVRLNAHLHVAEKGVRSSVTGTQEQITATWTHRRPMMSTARPQNNAPTVIPALKSTLRFPILLFGTFSSCKRT